MGNTENYIAIHLQWSQPVFSRLY